MVPGPVPWHAPTASAAGLSVSSDLGMFAAAASAWLNFTAGLVTGALAGGDTGQQALILRILTGMLANPLDVAGLELLLGAR